MVNIPALLSHEEEPTNLKEWKDFTYWDTSFTFASLEKRQKQKTSPSFYLLAFRTDVNNRRCSKQLFYIDVV